jgi:hypothetical protein
MASTELQNLLSRALAEQSETFVKQLAKRDQSISLLAQQVTDLSSKLESMRIMQEQSMKKLNDSVRTSFDALTNSLSK